MNGDTGFVSALATSGDFDSSSTPEETLVSGAIDTSAWEANTAPLTGEGDLQTGAFVSGTEEGNTYLTPADYSEEDTWTGPSLMLELPSDSGGLNRAKNFTYKISRVLSTASEGCKQILQVLDADQKNIASMSVENNQNIYHGGSVTVRMYIGQLCVKELLLNAYVHSEEASSEEELSEETPPYVDFIGEEECFIRKAGDIIEFHVNGQSHKFYSPDTKETIARYIVIYGSTKGTGPAGQMYSTAVNRFFSAEFVQEAATDTLIASSYLQFGNPAEEDTRDIEVSEVLFNDPMDSSQTSEWTVNVGNPLASDNLHTGTVNYYDDTAWGTHLEPLDYGTAYWQYRNCWHGPDITRILPPDSNGDQFPTSFTADFRHLFMSTSYAYDTEALTQLRVLDTDEANLVTVQFAHTSKGSDEATATVYLGPDKKKVKSVTFKCEGFTDYEVTSLSKYGSTFKIRMRDKTYSFTDTSLEAKRAKRVQVYMAVRGTYSSYTYEQFLDYVKVTSHNVAAVEDIPNVFAAGDILVADTKDGSVRVNGSERVDLGAIGNDWEGFRLMPGRNRVVFACSKWAARPSYMVSYREVFL